MKKLLLAIIVLVIIITSGVITYSLYEASSNEILKMLQITSDFIETGNWENAKVQINQIQEKWSKTEKVWAVLIDHFELDNIEMSLKKSGKYIASEDRALSLGELENLKFMVEHICRKEALNLENIF